MWTKDGKILNGSYLQRTFVGVDFFSVFQEIYLRTNDPRVSNIVKFSDAIGELKVEVGMFVYLLTISYQCQKYLAFLMLFSPHRRLHQSKMANASFSNLTKQHFLSSSCLLRFHIRYHSDFLEMKQRAGWTPHIYLPPGTSASQEETR